ncbi:MAG: 50S ribosomal protein L11 methyltransferase [Deltaproteobacteria bacterium]|nr:50S ribosomal protein L11 methyltransferase [Deltaproteobacteria bacterium]
MTPSSHQTTAWAEITVSLSPVAYEAAAAFLFDLGCNGLAFAQDDASTLKAYLPLPADLNALKTGILSFLRELEKIFPEVGTPDVTVTRLRQGDWAEGWRRFFRPLRATPRLLILPAWEPAHPAEEGEVILMDPGPAFGTGRHATTRMCLLAMERASLPDPWSLLDVGTGSGILAIYGAKLGAGRIAAIDLDPDAILWARRNIDLNGLHGRIRLSTGTPDGLQGPFTMVVANLTLAAILPLLPAFSRLVHPDGWLILSGLLRNQVGSVREGLKEQGFRLGRVMHRQEWACLVTGRKGKGH